jgi:hypothetical protein
MVLYNPERVVVASGSASGGRPLVQADVVTSWLLWKKELTLIFSRKKDQKGKAVVPCGELVWGAAAVGGCG